MNLQFELVRLSSLDELGDLRTAYIDGLIEPQELLLELWVSQSRVFRIDDIRGSHVPCGYVLVHDTQGIVEFHLETAYWIFAEPVFRAVIRQGLARRAWVKSFDHLYLSAALGLRPELRVAGLLVRNYEARPLPSIGHIRFDARLAQPRDLTTIERLDQNVFTDFSRVRVLIECGRIYVFEREQELVGFGMIQPVLPSRPDVDVAIAVDAHFRRRGYAIYILRWMFDHCLERGLRPIAGCSSDNTPSRTMGERVGLSARYRLLELTFAPSSDPASHPGRGSGLEEDEVDQEGGGQNQ